MAVTRREAMTAVFEGKPLDKLPVSVRLDLWHNDLVSSGCVPREIAVKSRSSCKDGYGLGHTCRSVSVCGDELVPGLHVALIRVQQTQFSLEQTEALVFQVAHPDALPMLAGIPKGGKHQLETASLGEACPGRTVQGTEE